MYLFFSVLLFLKQGKKVGLFLLFAILTIGLSDFTSSVLIKENIQRIRPCNDPVFKKQVFLRAPCGSGYSFTSSHATNHFALATFIILGLGTFIRKWRYLILFWAISIGFAQIYVGVHYPLDVLVGFLLGALIGGLGAFVYRKAIK
jgi:undecaprenyl-diphosphatase